MAGHKRQLGFAKLAVHDMQVGAAHPQAETATVISPGPGVGSIRSRIASGWPGRSRTMDRMMFMTMSVPRIERLCAQSGNGCSANRMTTIINERVSAAASSRFMPG